jgi:hypothetical protein
MEDREFDQSAMGSLVYNAARVIGERLIEQDPQDLSVFGLDKPQAKATAKYDDGTTAVFLLGNKTPAGNTYYMMTQGGDRVVTVWMNVGNSYLNKADALLAKEKLTLTLEDVDTVKVVKKGETIVEATTLGVDSRISITAWMIVQPWKRSVDTTALDTYLNSMLALQMSSVVEGKPADLAKYGLDNPEYEIIISGNGKTDHVLIGADMDGSYAYAKFAEGSTVYTVSKSSLEFTKTSAYKLMDKMILLVNIASTVGLEFQGLGQQGKLVIEHKPSLDDEGNVRKDGNGNPMNDQFFTIGGKDVEDKVARYFYQTCIGLSTHSLVKVGWQPSGEPVAVLTYTRNTDPTKITIEFMAYDKDFYAVRMDGQTHFLIKQEKVQRVADDLAKLKAGELTVP